MCIGTYGHKTHKTQSEIRHRNFHLLQIKKCEVKYLPSLKEAIDKFGLSLSVRYQQILKGEDFIELPEDSYHGDDIRVLAQSYIDENGEEVISCQYDKAYDFLEKIV